MVQSRSDQRSAASGAFFSFSAFGRIAVSAFVLAASLTSASCDRPKPEAEQTVAVPPEISSQLAAIEAATNGRRFAELANLFDDRASIQSVSLLGYGSKAQYLEAMQASDRAVPFKFGETVVVSERPGRIRTVSEVIRRLGEELVVERVAHEWARQGDRWVVRDQSFPDWSPIVGAWWRSEGDAKVHLRLLPSGIFEMADQSGVVVRRGIFATGTDSVTFTPDAVGVGATSESPIEASFRFEFDGSLEMAIVSGQEAAGIGSVAGTWKRQSMK